MNQWLKKLLNSIMGTVPETDTKTRDEIKAMLAELDTMPDDTKKPEGDKPPQKDDALNAQMLQLMKDLKAENESLKQQVKTLVDSDGEAKKKADAESKKSAADKAKAKIEEAVKAGRIAPKNEALIKSWTENLEADYDKASALIDAIPATIKTTDGTGGESKPDATKSSLPVNPFSKYVSEAFTINN